MKALILFVLLSFTPFSFAAVSLVEVINASNSIVDAGVAPVIYGGISGSDTDGDCATKTGLSTCNSCTSNLAVCNQQRIYDSLVLEVVFRSSGGTSGKVIATKEDRSTALPTQEGSSKNVDPNQDARIRLLWSEVCGVIGETAGGCTSGFAKPMLIGIDSNENGVLDEGEQSLSVVVRVLAADVANATIDHCEQSPAPSQGICSFTSYPGDSMAYIEDMTNAVGFPHGPGVKFTHLRFYYSKTNFAALTPNLGSFVDLAIEEDASGFRLADNRIKGLENNVPHFLRVATIDAARNVSNMTSAAAISYYCGSSPEANENCPFRLVPNKLIEIK